jgi:FtsH-binding integral membrane protein
MFSKDFTAPYAARVSPETADLVRTQFVKVVYQWMAGGLALTAASAFLVASNPALIRMVFQSGVFFVLILAELGLVIWLSGWIHKMSVRTASWAFLGYSVLNGVTLSVVLIRYTGSSVGLTFVVCAATFGSAAAYGTFTGRDLTGAGSFAFMGLIGIIAGSVLNWFFASAALDWLITYAGVAVFVVLAAYDAQKVQRIGIAASSQGEAALSRYAIMGALALYLDFINLFLFLLRIFGRSRD